MKKFMRGSFTRYFLSGFALGALGLFATHGAVAQAAPVAAPIAIVTNTGG